MKTAQTASPARLKAAENKEAMGVAYSRFPSHTSPTSETTVIEKQLGWAIQTLHNPDIWRSERRCLLDLAGGIMLDYLANGEGI